MQSFIRKVGSKMENSSGLETKSTRSRYMTSELVDFDIRCGYTASALGSMRFRERLDNDLITVT